MGKPRNFNISLLQLIFRSSASPNPIFPPNSAECLHFSAFHYTISEGYAYNIKCDTDIESVRVRAYAHIDAHAHVGHGHVLCLMSAPERGSVTRDYAYKSSVRNTSYVKP